MAELEIDILTLFPRMLDGFLSESILGNARESGFISAVVHDIRQWSVDKHKIVDDRPFGGGAGMVLKPEPLFAALEQLTRPESTVIYLCPDGEPLCTAIAVNLAKAKHLVLLSGHYEGIDQRVRDVWVDREVSIGDYVLTNGTLAAAVVMDAVCRHVPGVLGEEKSLTQDSFHNSLLSFPQYTRPAEFKGLYVPEVLLSGNHQAIEQWRRERQLEKTRNRRPELLSKLT